MKIYRLISGLVFTSLLMAVSFSCNRQTTSNTSIGDTAKLVPSWVQGEIPFKMSKIILPDIPDKVFNIVDYGAVGDGITPNTKALANAITACFKAGGGKVIVPSGKWLTGAIHLKSNVNFHMLEGAEIYFSTNPKSYLPMVFTRWAGFEVMNYSPLIYANGCENIAITGPGKLYGNGRSWWHWEKNDKKTGEHLQQSVINGVLPCDRIYNDPEVVLRPQFISPINCRNVLLEGFTIAEPGPFWTIHMVYCKNVLIRNLSIHTKGGPNTDGINIDSSSDVLIEGCLLDVGDDAVCLKSGINEDGRRVGRPTERVVVRNITALDCHGGIVIGSDMSGGVRDVLAYDCKFNGSDIGIRLKSNSARGGIVENIFYRNISMSNIKYAAISINTGYGAWLAAEGEKHYPVFRNIHLMDITCDGAGNAINIRGLPEKAVEQVFMTDMVIKAKRGLFANDLANSVLRNVTIIPEEGEAFNLGNCQSVTLENCSSIKPEIQKNNKNDVK